MSYYLAITGQLVCVRVCAGPAAHVPNCRYQHKHHDHTWAHWRGKKRRPCSGPRAVCATSKVPLTWHVLFLEPAQCAP